MPKCRICDHNNPAGTDRCQNCGSWIEQAVPSSLSGQEPRTASEERVPQPPNGLDGQILLLMQAGKKIGIYGNICGYKLARLMVVQGWIF